MKPAQLPEELIAKPGKPWITWSLLALFILGAVVWFVGPRVSAKGRSMFARHYAGKAADHLKTKNWIAANEAFTLAQQWSPNHPLVHRVLADLLVAVNADPASILHALHVLEMTGQATVEDQLRIGNIYAQQGDATNCLAIFKKLPEATQLQRPAQELLANIQRLQGDTSQAEATLRHALSLDKDDTMCRLRLAIMDQQGGFPEMRQEARKSLWELTAGKDRAALLAIDFLSKDPEINAVESDTLLSHVEAHPDTTQEARFNVLSALMKTRPQSRGDILTREISRLQNSTEQDLLALSIWLLRENEPARLLALKPGSVFTKSSALIEPYLQALADLNRWEEIDKIMSKPAGMPVSESFISLWRARAVRHLDSDTARARHLISTIYESSGHGRDIPVATAAVSLAEEAGLYDLAAQLYEGMAENQPSTRLPMLEKVAALSLRSRDGESLLRVSRQLLQIRPDNAQYKARVTYLELITGSHLEMHYQQLLSATGQQPADDETRLLRAIAAYRLGDLQLLRSQLDTISSTDHLTSGQRAVHAGLLSISGQVGSAYRIAEKIPAVLLLKEEASFLDRCL